MFVSHPIAGDIRETPDRRRVSSVVGVLFAMTAVMYLGAPVVLAQDWTSISGADRKIVFYAPKLNDKIRRSHTRTTADFSMRQEISTWYDTSRGKILSGIYLGELLGGYYYPRKITFDEIMRNWKFFEKRITSFGDKHSTGNKIGRIEYIMVNDDFYNCILFRSYSERSGYTLSLLGTTLLHGYYCVDENQNLSVEKANEVIRLLGVKDVGPGHSETRSECGRFPSEGRPGSASVTYGCGE